MIDQSELILRILLAAFLGGLIGYERQRSRHDPGLRTIALVSLGSALIAATEIFFRNGMQGSEHLRMSAQVVSGIGFLGAGAIIQTRFSVRGLTTAASLWVASAIGIASGLGFYNAAVISTFVVIVVLALLSRLPIEKKALSSYKLVVIYSNGQQTVDNIHDMLESYDIPLDYAKFYARDDGNKSVIISLPKGFDSSQLTADTIQIEGVKEVYIEKKQN